MTSEPDSSAVRTALWRALHVQIDAAPHLIDDEIGFALVAPADGWRDRPDMHPFGTRPYRAAIVARTRFVEDLLVDERIDQYILLGAGLDTHAPALVSSSGVSMYITRAATAATLQRLTGLAPGSILVMTFMLPLELADPADRPGLEGAARGAQASGTPWISFFTHDEMVALALGAGFASAEAVTTAEIAAPYLQGRADGLAAASGESILIART